MTHTPSTRWAAAATAACLLLPQRALAHLVDTGLGPVYDGVSHVLLSPDDLLAVLALALLAGLNGARAGRRALFALTIAWCAAGAAGYWAGWPRGADAATVPSMLLLGALVATDRRLPSSLLAAIGVAVGMLHGWLNGAGIANAGRSGLALIGIALTVFAIAALVAGHAAALRAAWSRVVARVAGSWIAATGLLMLGWQLRTAMLPG